MKNASPPFIDKGAVGHWFQNHTWVAVLCLSHQQNKRNSLGKFQVKQLGGLERAGGIEQQN